MEIVKSFMKYKNTFYSILSIDLIVMVLNIIELNRNIVCNRCAVNIDESVIISEPLGGGVNKNDCLVFNGWNT